MSRLLNRARQAIEKFDDGKMHGINEVIFAEIAKVTPQERLRYALYLCSYVDDCYLRFNTVEEQHEYLRFRRNVIKAYAEKV